GSRLGAFTMFVYMMLGLAGVPVFAQFKGGISMLLSPTFGFIVSFILIAYVAGKLVERKQSFSMYIVAALVPMALNYITGTHWMYAACIFWCDAPEGVSYMLAWMWMMVPLPNDIVITVLAVMFAFRLKRIIPLPSKTSQQQVA